MSLVRLGMGVLSLTLVISSSGCVRDLINKYQTTTKRPPSPRTHEQASQPQRAASPSRPNQPSIYALDEQNFRFRLPFEQVWDGAIGVLLRNYNLNIVDQNTGLITTEWDSFFLDQQIYRNKISMRIKKLAWDMVDVTIYNNVEIFRTTGPGGIASAWLPTDKGPQEVGRIVQNIAIALRQPAPVLPNEMIATKPDKERKTE
ncbi:MAG: hypothetical protein ACOH5I_06020 [Oligoflexus sp.]